MGDAKHKSSSCGQVLQYLDHFVVERWRSTCPVYPAHKSVFPADETLWQLGAATWVWGVLKALGGTAEAEALTQCLAQLRDSSRRQARGLRNRGIAVLEAFELIAVERLPVVRGGRATSVYGRVSIVLERIGEKKAREKKRRETGERWTEMLRQVFTPIEGQ